MCECVHVLEVGVNSGAPSQSTPQQATNGRQRVQPTCRPPVKLAAWPTVPHLRHKVLLTEDKQTPSDAEQQSQHCLPRTSTLPVTLTTVPHLRHKVLLTEDTHTSSDPEQHSQRQKLAAASHSINRQCTNGQFTAKGTASTTVY